jgi:hypothetical protein
MIKKPLYKYQTNFERERTSYPINDKNIFTWCGKRGKITFPKRRFIYEKKVSLVHQANLSVGCLNIKTFGYCPSNTRLALKPDQSGETGFLHTHHMSRGPLSPIHGRKYIRIFFLHPAETQFDLHAPHPI